MSWNTMPAQLRSFWRLVDDNGVPPLWVVAYYTPLLVFAVGAVIFLPRHLDNPLVGDLPILGWVGVQLVAIPAAIGGLLLRLDAPVAEMTSWQLRRDLFGLCLQAGGHACMCVMLIEFERALVKFMQSGVPPVTTLIWWLLGFSVAAISSYVFGTALLTLQCVRKVIKGMQLKASA
jgi:hypothetical protein